MNQKRDKRENNYLFTYCVLPTARVCFGRARARIGAKGQ